MGDRARPRRVVYLVIDGLRTDSFEQAIGSGRAPALAAIRERGSYVRDSTAVFPTITPCATSSLITGEMPDVHGIPGMCWYDRDEQRFVNYGQGPRLAVAEGLGEVATDMFVNLNHKHLSKDALTLHERLDDLGYVTASTNFMVHRGRHEPELNPASIGKLLIKDSLPASLPGPKEHFYADIVSGETEVCTDMLNVRAKAKRIRATDEWASCVVHDLLKRGSGDMILFYLHENDHVSHRHGIHTQVDNLIKGDEYIGHVLDALGSWDRTFDEVAFVLTADHGQSQVDGDRDHTMDLDDLLDDFERVRAKRGKDQFDDSKDLAACGNGRTAFVYLNEDRRDELLSPVAKRLLDAPGTDQVMWREDGWKVVDSSRGRLRFRRAQNGDGLTDERGIRWEVDGELAAVDGIVEDGELRTPEYPLALWRIDHALDLDRIGDVVMTTKLSYEVTDLVDESHRGGGEHGSLHVQDSQVPFLSTLDDPPLHPSTVDVAPHILRHFER